jgi:hypothetical protein
VLLAIRDQPGTSEADGQLEPTLVRTVPQEPGCVMKQRRHLQSIVMAANVASTWRFQGDGYEKVK